VEMPDPIEERRILCVLQRVAASCSVLQRVAVSDDSGVAYPY